MQSISIPIPVGELFDRISILEIKQRKLSDPAKLAHVERELAELVRRRPPGWSDEQAVVEFAAELDAANQRLWDVEDQLRDCERNGEFGPEFIELARSVYRLNDLRAEAKRLLSEHFGSELMEVKSYRPY